MTSRLEEIEKEVARIKAELFSLRASVADQQESPMIESRRTIAGSGAIPVASTSDDTFPFRVRRDGNKLVYVRPGTWVRNGKTAVFAGGAIDITSTISGADEGSVVAVVLYLTTAGATNPILRAETVGCKCVLLDAAPATWEALDETSDAPSALGPNLPNVTPNVVANHGLFWHKTIAYITLKFNTENPPACTGIDYIRQLWRGGDIKDVCVLPDASNDMGHSTVLQFSEGTSEESESGSLQLYEQDVPNIFASNANDPTSVNQCLRVPTVKSLTPYGRQLYWMAMDGEKIDGDIYVSGVVCRSIEPLSCEITQCSHGYYGYKLQLYNFQGGSRENSVASTMDLVIRDNASSTLKEIKYMDAYAFASFCSAYSATGGGGGYGWPNCPHCYDTGDYFWHLGGNESNCYGTYIGNNSQGKVIWLDGQVLLNDWRATGNLYSDKSVFVENDIFAKGSVVANSSGGPDVFQHGVRLGINLAGVMLKDADGIDLKLVDISGGIVVEPV